MTDWYTGGFTPSTGSPGNSAPIRSEYSQIAASFAKLPALSGHGSEIVRVNAGGTALESIATSVLATLLSASLLNIDDASNNAPTNVITMTHTTSGIPAVGIGTGIAFVTETSAGNNETGSSIQSIATNVTNSSEAFDIVFNTMSAGSLGEKARLTAGGIFNLPFGGGFSINNISVLNGNSLGSGIVNSSLTSLGVIASLVATTADINGGTIDGVSIGSTVRGAGLFTTLGASGDITGPSGAWQSDRFNLNTGSDYRINNLSVLSSTTLGSSVVNSSLTSVGTIVSGVWQGTPIAAGYVANLSGTNTGDEPTATESAEGVVELASNAEAAAGLAANRALTPANAASLNVGKVLGFRIEVLGLAAYNASAKASDTLYFINGA